MAPHLARSSHKSTARGSPARLSAAECHLTAAIFTGRVGDTYAFCSLATDRVGNVEQKNCASAPDAVTRIGASGCLGDCDGDGVVVVNELVLMVNIALGNAPASVCLAGDRNHDGAITIDENVTAVDNALSGCF